MGILGKLGNKIKLNLAYAKKERYEAKLQRRKIELQEYKKFLSKKQQLKEDLIRAKIKAKYQRKLQPKRQVIANVMTKAKVKAKPMIKGTIKTFKPKQETNILEQMDNGTFNWGGGFF